MLYYKIHIKDLPNFFTYKTESDNIKIGDWVKVIFNRREKIGIVVERDTSETFSYEVSSILDKSDGMVPIAGFMIELYKWIAEYYMCSFGEVLTFAYPKGLKIRYSLKVSLNKKIIPSDSMEEQILLYFDKKSEISKETIYKKFGKEKIDELIEREILKVKKYNVVPKVLKRENEVQEYESKKNIKLTYEQTEAKNRIINSKKRHFLIHGITGSGKTEVYIDLIKGALEEGKGSIFLVPEISLTPQMINRCRKEFGNSIAVLHSKLTDVERMKEWLDIYYGYKKIVLGVRSAIFAPIQNLKYIIIDEEHESTYKQDTAPRYHAKLVAIKRAEFENLKVIMGTATPSIESYFYAKSGVFDLIEMTKRYGKYNLPDVQTVNMQHEKDENFSVTLLEKIGDRLAKHEQSLLFLNRKGYSNFVQCKACGHIEKCDNCSVSYIYYKNAATLRCSYCGKIKPFIGSCEKCSSKDLNYYGLGTEKLEIELKRYFKSARILRVDSDTVKDRESYKKMYHDFLDEKYDVLLGTQMIAKGLHFPSITLSGIISADTILNFPDFRAGEKTFQVIVQAAGRAGRGEKKGEVIIQTYNPDHYVINRALKSDYIGFYNEEIELRKALYYPPFGRIINIIISSENDKILLDESNKFYRKIKFDGIDIFGPFPAPIYKIKNRFRYQIFVKGEREKINQFKLKLMEAYREKRDSEIRISIDVDPINLM